MENKNELAISRKTEAFELAQREAKVYSSSDMVPKAFQGADKLGNCMIALEMADRIKMSPFMVMQNVDIIHGKPGWSSQFLIASFNASGKFSPIEYEEDDKEGGRTRAKARSAETGDYVYGSWVSMDMAKAEGWSTKSGSKWKTMPEHMRRFRSAAFFIRTTSPEISMGMHTQDEIRDTGGMRNITPNENPMNKVVVEEKPKKKPAVKKAQKTEVKTPENNEANDTDVFADL
jgi:hypothetical protein